MSRITFRKLALLLAAAVATLVVSSSTASAGEDPDYPSPDCSISVTPENPTAGNNVTIKGENWPAGTEVHVTVGEADAGTATAGEDGTWELAYKIPDDAKGNYDVSADGCEDGEVLGTTITVGAAAAEALPATGSSSTEPLVRTAAVLIAAGAVLVYAVRRRSQAAGS